MQSEDQNQDAQVQDSQVQEPEVSPAATQEETRPKGVRKAKEKGDSLTPKEARKYVTTTKVRSRGRLRHPVTGVIYSKTVPKLGEGGPFSWIESQVQAGLMEEYK